MADRIVVDPVTRIEGHLRIEAEIKDGVIVDAFSSSTMVRGIEEIVKGRDPRDVWAFVQRTCGVCTTVTRGLRFLEGPGRSEKMTENVSNEIHKAN